jgi:hypothetical protein
MAPYPQFIAVLQPNTSVSDLGLYDDRGIPEA